MNSPGAIVDTFVQLSRVIAGAAAPVEILPRLARAAVDHLGARASAVFQVDPSGKARLVAVSNLPESLLGREVEPEAIDPPLVEEILSPREGERALTYPLASSGSLFGVLLVTFGGGVPEANWDELAQGLVDLAAIALEKAFHDAERERSARIEREEAEQRFLAEAGAVLGSSLDVQETLATLARLAVGRHADCCVIDLVDEEGRLRRTHIAHADPAKAEVVRALASYPLDSRRPHIPLSVLQSRRPALVPDLPPGYTASIAQDEAHLRILKELDPRSLMVVPLLARDHLLGTICFIAGPGRPRFGEADLRLAVDLAQRAALAIENARLYGAAQRATRARDEVLGVVVHDLRNPLSSILLYAKSFMRGLTPAEIEAGRARPFELMVGAAQRMNGLIEDLLDVTRIEAGPIPLAKGTLRTFDVVTEAAAGNRLLAEERGLTLTADVDKDLPPVVADRRRVIQIFSNLIGNALKFTPRGGTIRLGAEAQASAVRFAVSDTGAGIPKEHLPHVFDRFFQVRAGDRRGAGLGLAIVKGLVEVHGGAVSLESEIGAGTTFYFTLPRAAHEGKAAGADAGQA